MAEGPSHLDDLTLFLNVFGQEHRIEAQARVGPTRLLELLPLARRLCEAITAIALRRVEARGQASSCRPACGACCRQAVPVAPAEAIRLAEVVEAMPAERREAVERRFAEAVGRLEGAGLLDPGGPGGRARLRSEEPRVREAWREASRRYFRVGVPCPFLEDESCSIYPERPLACREYHVTSPPALCATLGPGLSAAPRPVHMNEVLVEVTNEALGRDDYAIPLVLALEWAGRHRAAFDRSGDGALLAASLIRWLQRADDAAAAEESGG
jgi:Fe-S-cluster containining protein